MVLLWWTFDSRTVENRPSRIKSPSERRPHHHRNTSPDYGTVGAEAGASALLRLAPGAYLYAAYDARLRGNLALHTATGGMRFVF